MFTGIESLQARFDGEDSSTETAVDVEVRVAEEVEEATSIIEEATQISQVSEQATQVVEEVEAIEAWAASIQKYGITPQGMELMNYQGKLAAISGIMMPGAESLDVTGRNHEAAQIVLDGIKDTAKKAWEAIKKFFKDVWERIKTFFAKIMTWITSWERSCKKAYESIKDIKDADLDDKKLDDRKLKVMSLVEMQTVVTELSSAVATGTDQTKLGSRFSDEVKKIIGIKTETTDGKDELVTSDPKKFEENSLKSLKYSASGLAGFYTGSLTKYLSEMRKVQGHVKVVEQKSKQAIGMIDSLMRSADSDSAKEDKKKEVKEIQNETKRFTKFISVIGSRMSFVPATFVKACAAVKSCKK